MGKKLVIAIGLVAAAIATYLAVDRKNSEASASVVRLDQSPITSQADKLQANQSSSPTRKTEAKPATIVAGSAPENTVTPAQESNHQIDNTPAQKRRFSLKQGIRTARNSQGAGGGGAFPHDGSTQTGTSIQSQQKSTDSRATTARTNDISFAPSRGILEDYAVYFAQANLTPEEKKQFLTVISEERAAARDIRELSKTTELSPDEQIKLLRENLNQTRQDLAAVLPDSKVAAYHDYRANLPYRNLVETVSAICTPEGQTIPAETKEAVISTLRKTKEFSPWTGSVRNNRDLSQGDELACSAVSNLLTPKQLEALRTTLDQRRTEAAKLKLSAPAKQ